MTTCDVLIAGGGPAGSTCAWALGQAGLDVVIVDKATFPRDKVCATPKAVLGFHSAWRPTGNGGKVSSIAASQAMMDVYPADLRKWIARRGGLTPKMIFLQGRELAQIVPPCGTTVSASARATHEPRVLKSYTTHATIVARQAR